MKTITEKEFKKDLDRYADLAETERVLVKLNNKKAFLIIPIKLNKGKYIVTSNTKEIKDYFKVRITTIINIQSNNDKK